LGFVPEIGRFFDGVGEILDVLELEPLFVRLAVEDLESRDFVFVLCDELFEGLYDGTGARQCIGAEACFDDLVLADVVDDDLVLALDVGEQLAEFGLHQRLHRLLHGRGSARVRVKRLNDGAAQVFQAEAAARGADLGFVFGAGAEFHARDARGDR
jgi:hypothetical protein